MTEPRSPKMTMPMRAALKAFLVDASEPKYGLEIAQAADLSSGTLYPLLARLTDIGWIDSWWENIDPAIEGRPRRKYYQLSPRGLELARNALAHHFAARKVARPAWLGTLAGGI